MPTARAEPRFTVTAGPFTATSGSVTIPGASHLFSRDTIVIHIVGHPSDAIAQTAGPALGVEAGLTGNFAGTGKLYTWSRIAASDNGDGKYSTDDGATFTFSNASSTRPWSIILQVYDGAYILATPFNATQSSNTASGTSLSITGATPTIDNALHQIVAVYVTASAGVSQTFQSGTGVGSDVLLGQVNSASGSVANRGIALWSAAGSPTINVPAATRTANFNTPQTSAIAAYSYMLRPIGHVAGDERYDIRYAPGGSSSEQRGDMIYPTTGVAPFRVVVHLHGGLSGDKAMDTNPRHAARALAERYGVAVFSINFRTIPNQTVAPAYLPGVQDIHCALRALDHFAAEYNLRPASQEYPRLFGNSFGAAWAAAVAVTNQDPYYRDDSLGHAAYSSRVSRVLLWYGAYHPAFSDAYWIQLGQPGNATVCGTTSAPAQAVGTPAAPVNVCLLRRFDGLDFPGSLAGGDQVNDNSATTYNRVSQIWSIRNGGVLPGTQFWVAHGDADPTQPHYGSSCNVPGLPRGLVEELGSAGVPVRYSLLAGAVHGGPAWRDSLTAGATHGAEVDAMLAWVAADIPAQRRPARRTLLRLATLLQRGAQFLTSRLSIAFGTGAPPVTPLPPPSGGGSPLSRNRRGGGRRWRYIP